MNKILEIALRDYGVAEIKGDANNPEVLKWFTATDANTAEWVNDETPSCSAAMCYWVEAAGLPSTRSVTARSWEHWGELVVGPPQPGDIAVYFRNTPEDWPGHVAIVVTSDEKKKTDWVHGANQSDMACIQERGREKLLCYRTWPKPEVKKTTLQKLNTETMQNLKGWKTIIFLILTAAAAGVDSLTGIVDIPSWYYQFIVPAVAFILRFLTDGPVGGE